MNLGILAYSVVAYAQGLRLPVAASTWLLAAVIANAVIWLASLRAPVTKTQWPAWISAALVCVGALLICHYLADKLSGTGAVDIKAAATGVMTLLVATIPLRTGQRTQ